VSAILAKKLQIKPGQRMLVLNAPEGYVAKLVDELEGIAVVTACEPPCDAVLLFVNSLAEADRCAAMATSAVGPDGLVWMAYPKGTSGVTTDVNRDRLGAAMKAKGWPAVRQVAIDDIWSALRFRRADRVGK